MIIITIIVSSQIFRGECKEHATNISNVDVEALRNLSSMYNNGTLKMTNLEVTGNIKGKTLDITDKGTIGPHTVGNNGVTISGNINMDNNWAIRPSTNRNMYFGTHTAGYKPGCWVNAEWLYANDLIRANKRMETKGAITADGAITSTKDSLYAGKQIHFETNNTKNPGQWTLSGTMYNNQIQFSGGTKKKAFWTWRCGSTGRIGCV